MGERAAETEEDGAEPVDEVACFEAGLEEGVGVGNEWGRGGEGGNGEGGLRGGREGGVCAL